MRHVLFFLLTRMGLVIRFGWKTSFINLAARSRAISSLMAFHFLSFKRRRCYLTGLAPNKMSKLCSATSLEILGMSEGLHAKMSRFLIRKSISARSYLSERPQLIQTILLVSSGLTCTALVSSVGLKAPEAYFFALDSGVTLVAVA